MKRIMICSFWLLFSTVTLCQQTNLSVAGTKQQLLQKSKHQRTTGWILAGGGVVLEAAGVIAYQYGNSSLFLLGTGFLAQVASIPFFVSAAINKHKAKKASLSFNLKKIPGRQPAMIFPSRLQLAVKIPL